jgi:hypothetical protein
VLEMPLRPLVVRGVVWVLALLAWCPGRLNI